MKGLIGCILFISLSVCAQNNFLFVNDINKLVISSSIYERGVLTALDKNERDRFIQLAKLADVPQEDINYLFEKKRRNGRDLKSYNQSKKTKIKKIVGQIIRNMVTSPKQFADFRQNNSISLSDLPHGQRQFNGQSACDYHKNLSTADLKNVHSQTNGMCENIEALPVDQSLSLLVRTVNEVNDRNEDEHKWFLRKRLANEVYYRLLSEKTPYLKVFPSIKHHKGEEKAGTCAKIRSKYKSGKEKQDKKFNMGMIAKHSQVLKERDLEIFNHRNNEEEVKKLEDQFYEGHMLAAIRTSYLQNKISQLRKRRSDHINKTRKRGRRSQKSLEVKEIERQIESIKAQYHLVIQKYPALFEYKNDWNPRNIVELKAVPTNFHKHLLKNVDLAQAHHSLETVIQDEMRRQDLEDLIQETAIWGDNNDVDKLEKILEKKYAEAQDPENLLTASSVKALSFLDTKKGALGKVLSDLRTKESAMTEKYAQDAVKSVIDKLNDGAKAVCDSTGTGLFNDELLVSKVFQDLLNRDKTAEFVKAQAGLCLLKKDGKSKIG